jgi:hypothetical protein
MIILTNPLTAQKTEKKQGGISTTKDYLYTMQQTHQFIAVECCNTVMLSVYCTITSIVIITVPLCRINCCGQEVTGKSNRL